MLSYRYSKRHEMMLNGVTVMRIVMIAAKAVIDITDAK